jgi:hypothetical protein
MGTDAGREGVRADQLSRSIERRRVGRIKVVYRIKVTYGC